jgi:hypothetical protein
MILATDTIVRMEEGPDVNSHRRSSTPAHDEIDRSAVRHLGNVLAAARGRSGDRMSRLAKRSDGRFTPDDLRAYERGAREADADTMLALVRLYGCDPRAALPARPTVCIEHDRVVVGEMSAAYDPADHTTVMPAFVRLVRTLRTLRAEDELDLRRPDMQVVTTYWAHCLMDQVQGEATPVA